MSYLNAQQIRSMSTSALVLHFGVSFEIEVTRSAHNSIPCIVFRSTSRGLVSALGTHHAHKLQKMQSTWKQWTSGARADKISDGLFYNVISLKGLRPSTLRAWIAAARNAGFVVTDKVFPVEATTVVAESTPVAVTPQEDPWTQPISTEIVDEIPTGTRAVYQVNHKPFGLPGKVASAKDLKKVLRAQGKCTTGNKAALLARL